MAVHSVVSMVVPTVERWAEVKVVLLVDLKVGCLETHLVGQ